MNISLEKELNSLKKTKEAKTEKETPLNEVKLLLDSNSQEDLRISRGLGKLHSLTFAEEKLGEKMEREKMEKQYGAIFTIDQIETLAIKYHLRFLQSSYFTGELSVEVLSKIKEFAKQTGADISGASLGQKFFILAPAECFALENKKIIRKKDLDPVLFYRVDSGKYRMIHKWGKDFTLLRAIEGWKYKGFRNYRLFQTLIVMPIVAAFLTLILPTWLKYNYGFMFIPMVLIASFALGFCLSNSKLDSDGKSNRRFWSDYTWNSTENFSYA